MSREFIVYLYFHILLDIYALALHRDRSKFTSTAQESSGERFFQLLARSVNREVILVSSSPESSCMHYCTYNLQGRFLMICRGRFYQPPLPKGGYKQPICRGGWPAASTNQFLEITKNMQKQYFFLIRGGPHDSHTPTL